jgi:hypothetical protein
MKEPNIRAMPFKDPRGFKVYNTPPAWGNAVRIGDTVWIETRDLDRSAGIPGTVSDTDKEGRILATTAVVATVLGAAASADSKGPTAGSTDSAKPPKRRTGGHFEKRLGSCSSCGGTGASVINRITGYR